MKPRETALHVGIGAIVFARGEISYCVPLSKRRWSISVAGNFAESTAKNFDAIGSPMVMSLQLETIGQQVRDQSRTMKEEMKIK